MDANTTCVATSTSTGSTSSRPSANRSASTASRRRRTARATAIPIGIHTSTRPVTTIAVVTYVVRGGCWPAHQNRFGSRSQVTHSIST
ncbi:hypothetical protein C1I92_32455 [Jiangella anatolica]|uniref:Uncharacterized protein n=1 Tax=Jiangella anatolica TaxID=2670374 RepID=A0A2W2BG14_9ACTN|nr:hypothetical protein C1I92_32455 [Jiangella anatolica]